MLTGIDPGAARRSRRGPSSARCRRSSRPVGDELRVLGSNDPIALYRARRRVGRSSTTAATTPPTPRSTWPRPAARDAELRLGRREQHATTAGADRGGRCHERQAEAEQPWRDWASHAALPARGPGSGAAQRADPAGAVPRADRGDPRRRHLVAARGDRRPAQLGLPLLLAARRGDERAGAGHARLRRRGRGAAAWTRRHHRAAPPGTPSGCTRCTQWTVSSWAPRP